MKISRKFDRMASGIGEYAGGYGFRLPKPVLRARPTNLGLLGSNKSRAERELRWRGEN